MAYTLSTNGVMYMIGGSYMDFMFVPTFSKLSVVNNVPQIQTISNITNSMFNRTLGPLVGHTATLIGNHVYVIGGRWFRHPIVAFNIDTGEQTTLICNFAPNVDKNVSYLNGHTATYVNNKLYVYGGMVSLDNRNLASNTMYILDFNDPSGVPTWSSNNGAPDARFFHSATLLPNNVIMYIFGKSSISTPSTFNSYTLYDTRNNTWYGPFTPAPPNLFSLSISPHISSPPAKGGSNAALIGGICGGVAVLISVTLFLNFRRKNSRLTI
ncbi:hypothetical protein BGZ76_005986 [Entomortierella beljakovae]|nr:hypothetical protein BGZ76_005986 [Entomortierella beljakovae]